MELLYRSSWDYEWFAPAHYQLAILAIRNKDMNAVITLMVFTVFAENDTFKPDLEMIAKIREEGFQRSQVMDIVGYMTDVLGARLTLSQDMKRAQIWAKEKMEKIGLSNIVIEPFMDYGVTWDNEYFSLHLIEPDYQPMMGFPLTHTPSTKGKISCPVIIADVQTKKELEKHRGKLQGAAVLWTPPAAIDLERMAQATPDDLKKNAVIMAVFAYHTAMNDKRIPRKSSASPTK